MAKQIKLEIARENPDAGNWLYADLQLPAEEHEIRDAFQRARITSSDVYHEYSIYECEAIPILPFRRLDSPSIDELNFLAKRLDELNDMERIVLRAVSPRILKAGEDEIISPKDLINMTYGLDDVSVIANVNSSSDLGQFVIDNDLNLDVEAIPKDSLYLLDAVKIGQLQQQNDGGVFMDGYYKLCEEEYMTYDKTRKYLYTEETLQEVCLGINSMCVGSESKYFNGHTNITDGDFLCFGVKGLMDSNKRLKDAMLFNILSYMSNQLLGEGNTAASIDELYLFLTNMTAIEYIRNAMKRVRKKDSSVILASQNIEDFLIPSIREFTKPLFSIPTHQFLFNAGQINPKEYMDALQIEPSEFELIKYPERGTCLYRCGNERYLLQVTAPEYKSAIFGSAGGR